jgi:transcriptional regulator NrdR family protein
LEVTSKMDVKPGELRCPRCFKQDIAPSLPRGVVDAIMKMSRRVPRHCRACGNRFYVAEYKVRALSV